MVIFGGNWYVFLNDAWKLENANGQGGTPQWTQINPTGTLPTPRIFNSLVYNPETDRMIVFGGANWDTSPGIFNDVWVLTDAMGASPYSPPVALCQNVTVSAGPACNANASIDNGSYSPSGGVITLAQSPAGPYPLDNTSVTLTVTDSNGTSSQCSGTVTVLDKTPPMITAASAKPSVLWPPNHKMVTVNVNYTAGDSCSESACQIVGVASNEPISRSDYEVVDAHHVKLRAERLGTGNDRIYTINISCTDLSGNSSSQTVTVSVPHDQGKK
jgi:hypothetical protein